MEWSWPLSTDRLGPLFILPWRSEIWSERLAKGPHQKNTPLAVKLKHPAGGEAPRWRWGTPLAVRHSAGNEATRWRWGAPLAVRLAKSPHQKNTPLAVRLEPAVSRLKIRVCYEWNCSGPKLIGLTCVIMQGPLQLAFFGKRILPT